MLNNMEKCSVSWDDFQLNVSKSFSVLRKEQDFFDVTLVSEDDVFVKAHKVVLSASSEFFKNILRKVDHSNNPMIYLSGIGSTQLSEIINYIYEGEAQLFQDDLESFLSAGQKLRIGGLINMNSMTENHETEKVSEDIIQIKEEEIEEIETTKNDESFLPKVKSEHKKKDGNGKSKSWVCHKLEDLINKKSGAYEDAKRAVDKIITKRGDFWVCQACNKPGKSNNNMRKHCETHIEGLAFPCQTCGQTFKSRSTLSNHKQNSIASKGICISSKHL